MFRDKFGIFLYMKPTLLHTFYIWGEYLWSDKAPETQGNLYDLQQFSIQFVTSVCDNQRKDNIVTRHKCELIILFSKFGSEKERKDT